MNAHKSNNVSKKILASEENAGRFNHGTSTNENKQKNIQIGMNDRTKQHGGI